MFKSVPQNTGRRAGFGLNHADGAGSKPWFKSGRRIGGGIVHGSVLTRKRIGPTARDRLSLAAAVCGSIGQSNCVNI